jgi:hypothetical protein
MERSLKELRSFVMGRQVNITEAVAGLFVEFQMGGVFHLDKQALSGIVALNQVCIVQNTFHIIIVTDGMRRLIKRHTVQNNIVGNLYGTILSGVFSYFTLATLFQRLLTGSQEQHAQAYYNNKV